MNAPAILEIACFSLESALTAQAAGADRIELCEDYAAGGVTPSETLIAEVKSQVKIPVHVMIRPRAGNFVYSEQEIAAMEASILFCKEQGLAGIVFGALSPAGEVNVPVCRRFKELAGPMPVTFHRAIDDCRDIKSAMQDLISIGTDRVLSSGRGATALEGIVELTIMQKIFGRQIQVLPGGSIRSSNLQQLLETGCNQFHSSGIVSGPHADADEIRAMKALLAKAAHRA